MASINEGEFEALIDGLIADRSVIIRHNPIGTDEEIMLWMLMSCLVSYLSLDTLETPCFSGRPNAATYRDAVRFILTDRRTGDFDPEPYLDKLSA